MEQATIDSIKRYAYFFNDLRGIANNNHYQLTQDRLKGLEAEFEALNGIIEDIKADPDREGAKVMLKGWAGLSWPVMLALSAKEEEQYKWGLAVNFPSKPQHEIEGILQALMDLLARCNRLTTRIAGAVGLMAPIDPVEAGAFFFDDFVRSDKWQRYLDKLDDFRASVPSKRAVAILAFYLKGTKMARRAKSWKGWHGDFCNLLGVDAGTYKSAQIELYCSDPQNEKEYLDVVGPFMPILPQ